MRRFSFSAYGGLGGRSTAVILALFLATSTGAAATSTAPARVQEPAVDIRDVGPVNGASLESRGTLARPASKRDINSCLCVGLTRAHGFLAGAILGDRQRMVQVALICMGIAILILTRGNRF